MPSLGYADPAGSPVPEAVAGMIILFREVAEADLEEAISYYEDIDLDLALRFQDEVARVIQRIDDHPELTSWCTQTCDARASTDSHHALYYRIVDDDTVVVVACIHPSRDPTIWMHRRYSICLLAVVWALHRNSWALLSIESLEPRSGTLPPARTSRRTLAVIAG